MSWLQRLTERWASPAKSQSDSILSRALPLWLSARPLPQPNDYKAFAEDGYRRNTLIFSCISEIVWGMLEAPLRAVQIKADETEAPLPPTHPLAMLMTRPNPETSQDDFLARYLMHSQVAGNAYLHKVRARNNQIAELWTLRPDRTQIKVAPTGRIEGYKFSVAGTFDNTPLISKEDVSHFLLHPDPLDDFYGLSPISVIARMGDIDNEAADYLRAFFSNQGIPAGLLKFKAGQIPAAERARVRQMWKDQYQGAKGWHDVAVLDADVDFQALSTELRKLDLSSVWGMTETRICAVFNIHPLVLGVLTGLQHATFSNYKEARIALWEETLLPLTGRVCDRLTLDIAQEFGSDLAIRPDLSKVQALKDRDVAHRQWALGAWDSKLVTRNQALTLSGLPPVEDGDEVKPDPAPAFAGFPSARQSARRPSERHIKYVDTPADDPFYLAIHKIADRLTPAMQEAFIEAVLATQGKINEAVLIEAVESGNIQTALSAIPLEAFADALKANGTTIVQQVYAEAGRVSATQLQDLAGISMLFDLTNPRARAYAATQTATLVTEVSQTTKEAVRDLLERSFVEGIPPSTIARDIRELVGLRSDQVRAVQKFRDSLVADGITGEKLTSRVEKYAAAQLNKRGVLIARTELLSASNAGQSELWQQAQEQQLLSPDQEREWIVTPDDRLDTEICEPMDGARAKLSEPFILPDGSAVMIPQQSHPQCLPGDMRVISPSSILAVSDRAYHGDLIVIHTASGKQLSCTPNHPILTRQGWVAASLLQVGDSVVSSRLSERETAGTMDNQDRPSSIHEIAETFRGASHVTTVPVPVAAPDFHGDGKGSNVAIIRTNRLLGDDRNIQSGQPVSDPLLVSTTAHAESLYRRSFGDLFVNRRNPSASCCMRRSRLRNALGSCHSRPFQTLSLRAASRDDAMIHKPMANHASIDTVFDGALLLRHSGGIVRDHGQHRELSASSRDGLRTIISNRNSSLAQRLIDSVPADVQFSREARAGSSGLVFTDKIVHIDVQRFSGHVYNLHTRVGLYVAQGIVTHNCRCAQGLSIDQ